MSISGHLKFIYFCSIQGQNGSFFEKDDFSDLPPNQRRKRLQGKIEEITGKVTSLLEVSDHLMLSDLVKIKRVPRCCC